MLKGKDAKAIGGLLPKKAGKPKGGALPLPKPPGKGMLGKLKGGKPAC
jgi:hypothetical protein